MIVDRFLDELFVLSPTYQKIPFFCITQEYEPAEGMSNFQLYCYDWLPGLWSDRSDFGLPDVYLWGPRRQKCLETFFPVPYG